MTLSVIKPKPKRPCPLHADREAEFEISAYLRTEHHAPRLLQVANGCPECIEQIRSTFKDQQGQWLLLILPLTWPKGGVIGRHCRVHKDTGRPGDLLGCSGEGRPSCQAGECLYGAEPCPNGNHWKPEGSQCLFCSMQPPKC